MIQKKKYLYRLYKMSVGNGLSLAVYGYIDSDFSTSFVDDNSGNTPNSLSTNPIGSFKGEISNMRIYSGIVGDYYSNNGFIPTINYTVSNNSSVTTNNGVNVYTNNDIWAITTFLDASGNKQSNVSFDITYDTNNSSNYNLIVANSGITLQSSPITWYSTSSDSQISYQIIIGSGNIPDVYVPNSESNPFTDSDGTYYNTYIKVDDNDASHSGYVLIYSGPYNSKLVNPSYVGP